MSMGKEGSQHFGMSGRLLIIFRQSIEALSLLDSRSFPNCHQSMGKDFGRGGVINGKIFYLLFTCFRAYRSFLSNKSFLQEKTGNILVGGYPPPLIGKRPINIRFFS